MRGLGPKLEESVLAALDDELDAMPGRTAAPRGSCCRGPSEIGEELVAGLRERRRRRRAGASSPARSRRQADSVKDIDIVATTTRPTTLAKSLAQARADRERELRRQGRGARARTHSGIGVDLRIAAPAQLGNLLQHFTGSGAHNAALRERAVRAGLHVSEYGILDDATGAHRPRARASSEVYERLGLAYIEPELREDRGELRGGARRARCRS